MRESLASFCQRNDCADLLREWDSERNLPLTPESVSYGSKKKVWWTCAQGHHWQAAVHTRTGSGTGCPYCSGRFPIPGENDLATKYPLLAQEWNTDKWRPHSARRASRQPSHRLVALCAWPSVARTGKIPRQRIRLSRLHQQNRAERRQRPRHPAASPRQRMAPH